MGDCIDLFSEYQERESVRRGPIQVVRPLPGGTLRMVLKTGSVLDVPLKQYLHKLGFCPLNNEKIWSSVETDGCFVCWYRHGVKIVEMTWVELITLAIGTKWI